jgi:hypothetical protein
LKKEIISSKCTVLELGTALADNGNSRLVLKVNGKISLKTTSMFKCMNLYQYLKNQFIHNLNLNVPTLKQDLKVKKQECVFLKMVKLQLKVSLNLMKVITLLRKCNANV